jgi:hypothetical protein
MIQNIFLAFGLLLVGIVLLEAFQDISGPGGLALEGLLPAAHTEDRMSQVEVAILYQRITDGLYHPSRVRTWEELLTILRETRPDFIFRVWWRWTPTPETLPPSHPQYLAGHTYQQLEETLSRIKEELPEAILCGSVGAQRINFQEHNPITGRVYPESETWEMALDPTKWGIAWLKEEFQRFAQEQGGTGEGGYFPDITHPVFQELLLSWARRQIEAGVDALFVDMLFTQARLFHQVTGDPHHPAVRAAFEAAAGVVEALHEHGEQLGRPIYVGTWWTVVELPFAPPPLDFVTASPTVEEVRNRELDAERWEEIVAQVRGRLGEIPLFAFIDWAGTTRTPLGAFTQELSREEQRAFLRHADEFFSERDIVFIYPVHGGFMGQDASRLSFGVSRVYDALAPEFETYETIVELAEARRLDVPHEYLLWYKAWDRFLEELAQPPEEFHPMEFGAHLITANPFVATFPEAYRQGTPEEPAFNDLPADPFAFWDVEISLGLIDLFAELGVDYVKVMMRYPEDPAIRENYDLIFQRIREHGLELLIRHDVMGPEYLHIDPKAPDAFEKELEKREAFIYDVVARYRPEYLELPPGPTGWRALLQMLPQIRRWLDEVSPRTKIVMLTGPVYDHQVEEFKAAVDSPYVDIVAVHLVELIYPSYRARVEEMARYARARGKTLWSTDTWLSDGGWAYHGPAFTPEGYEPFTFETMAGWLHEGEYAKVLEKLDLPWREPLDARWQEAVVYWAQRLEFESVSPFHVQYFVDYSTSFYTSLGADISSWKRSLEEGRRTQVFHAYREIIQEVRGRSSAEVPPQARAWYEEVNAWLDEKLAEWRPEEFRPMSFCAHHIVASERVVTKTDEEMDRRFLEVLKETGVDCIRISISPCHYARYRER